MQRKAKEIGLDLNTVLEPTKNGAPYPGTVAAAGGSAEPDGAGGLEPALRRAAAR